ncbi:hypothetical protein [Arthrobacter sp. LAR12-1-1.1]|uniref:hypothetical protein n=1 Tax=Arthrobacter sp. LAR12-1-1.1 TaxID=3135215 RepID=UPI00342E718C
MSLRILAAAGLAVLTATTTLAPANAAPVPAEQAAQESFSFGVIGDIPYGQQEAELFPSRIGDLNADLDLDFVAHVGDIKNGSSACTDEYFARIRAAFDTFELPLVYTPGDNEWVDCHRENNGSYNPLERLDKVREVFFPSPGKTLGATMPVKSQNALGLPENVRFTHNRVAFSVLNIQGSNNSLQPWTGLGRTETTPEQRAEVRHRIDATIDQLHATFTDATLRNDRAVVIMTQADMFDPSLLAAATADPKILSGFREIIDVLVKETNNFDAPVYLVNGDSHIFAEDQPLGDGSPWLRVYGQDTAADDLQRITVDGSANATNYVKFTVAANSDATGNVLDWKKVPYTS